jgi:hypothetical protein
MPVSFDQIKIDEIYSRPLLAKLWGYSTFHAIARGVVTPRDSDKIILFVTEDKQASAEQYKNALLGSRLEWEGPKDHFAQARMLKADASGDEIHLFHRERHHSDFTYRGRLTIVNYVLHSDRPSSFIFKVL